MLESIRRAITLPGISATQALGLGVVVAFLWLLAHDSIHPFAIYLAQIYLMF